MKCVQWSEHMHAYVVEEQIGLHAIRPGEEIDFQTLDCYNIDGLQKYVSLKYLPIK